MVTTPLFVALALFMAISAGVLALYRGLRGSYSSVEEQLDDLAVKVRMVRTGFREGSEPRHGLAALLLRWAMRRVPAPSLDSPAGEKLVQLLSYAGFSGAGAVRVLQLSRLATAVLGGVLGFVFATLTTKASWPLLYSLSLGVLFSQLPLWWLRARANRRKGRMARELSDVIDLLVVCVEAGMGVFEAVKIVGQESERQGRALGAELAKLSAEITAGASLAEAFRSLAERTGVEDIKGPAAVLIQSEKLGAQIGPALRAISDSMRGRRKLRAEEFAQKSTVKMLVPLVLFVLPAMLIVVVGPALIQILHTIQQ